MVYSQTPPYYHYTPSVGLASSTVYDIIQDRNGFIWIATLNGLNRFDGSRFLTYQKTDGLNSNSITSLMEGNNGELYIGNYESGINVLYKGRIESYRTKVKDAEFRTTYLTDTKEHIYAYGPFTNIVKIAKKGIAKTDDFFNPRTQAANPNLNRIIKTGEEQLLLLTSKGLFGFDGSTISKYNIPGLEEKNLNCGAADKDGNILIGTEGAIYRINDKKVIATYSINLFSENNVSNLIVDSRGGIWFSISGKGFYTIPAGSDEIINIGSKLDLKTAQITKFIEDNEGNIWIATFGKGVYCLTNIYLLNYSEDDGLVNNYVNSVLKVSSGRLLIGTINGISILENGSINQLLYNSGRAINGYINNLIKKDNNIYVSLTSNESESIEVFYKDLKLQISRLQSICETSNGLFLFGGIGNNIVVQKEFKNNKYPEWNYLFDLKAQLNRINIIKEDSKKNIWVGTGLGLCRITDWIGKEIGGWKKTYYINDPVLGAKINSVYEDNEGNVWFAGLNGVARYNSIDNSIKHFINFSGHDLTSSNSIALDSKRRIWIGNLKGVYIIDGDSLKYLNSQTGLPSNEVLSLEYDNLKDKMYIGTSNGLSELSLSLFENYKQMSPALHLNNFTAGNLKFTDKNNLEFERDQNNIAVDISAINYSSPSTIKYRYKLNNIITETGNNKINYASLENGDYQLEIFAKTQNSGWSKPYIITFRILPHFYETIWFYALLFALLICFHLMFIYWRIRLNRKKIKKELELAERINELKHQALSAMMNPHFIFNSLNSVQYLVNSKRNEEANDYIAVMAKLIRKNLETAGDAFILLSEEISRLKLYLDLEKLRFQDKFIYEIFIGDDIDTNSLMIPNMIIQPFVENSLWHGIINSGIEGLLKISFQFEEVDIDSAIYKSLVIRVTDNGVGINEAKKSKKEDHISKGIQIIEERLRLLSARMEIPKPIMFEDLNSVNSNLHGTEIIISLPPPLYKIS